jgi:hypothetical protein
MLDQLDIEAISEENLTRLVDARVSESRTLDFKRALPKAAIWFLVLRRRRARQLAC